MSRIQSLGLFLVLFMLVACIVVPATAQEATLEPVPTEPPVVVTPPDDTVWLTGAQLLLYLALAAFGGGGLLAVIFRFLDRKEARDTGEKLYESASPETQQLIKDIVEGYRRLSERLLNYFDAITDGLPNEDVPPQEARNTGPLPPGIRRE